MGDFPWIFHCHVISLLEGIPPKNRPSSQVQIILAGPPDDACGLYAGTLLDQLGSASGIPLPVPVPCPRFVPGFFLQCLPGRN